MITLHRQKRQHGNIPTLPLRLTLFDVIWDRDLPFYEDPFKGESLFIKKMIHASICVLITDDRDCVGHRWAWKTGDHLELNCECERKELYVGIDGFFAYPFTSFSLRTKKSVFHFAGLLFFNTEVSKVLIYRRMSNKVVQLQYR